MGIYLNPNNDSFQMMLNTDTYVDKSLRQSEYAFSLLQQGL